MLHLPAQRVPLEYVDDAKEVDLDRVRVRDRVGVGVRFRDRVGVRLCDWVGVRVSLVHLPISPVYLAGLMEMQEFETLVRQ